MEYARWRLVPTAAISEEGCLNWGDYFFHIVEGTIKAALKCISPIFKISQNLIRQTGTMYYPRLQRGFSKDAKTDIAYS